MEREAVQADLWLIEERLLQVDITSAVAVRFSREMLPETITVEAHPALAALSARAEATEAFQTFPFN